MPRLVLINAAPASGRSTLARMYVEERPLTLALDIDVVRVMLGCWLDEPVEAGLIARRGAIQMARVQVGADRFARRSRHPQTSAHRDAQAPLDRSGGP